MKHSGRESLYRSTDVLLLRAAAEPITAGPARWPDFESGDDLRAWLIETWKDPATRDAVGHASAHLAARVDSIILGNNRVPDRQVASAAVALTRYLLRAAGRPTPFGLFAGVAPARFSSATRLRFGTQHQAVAGCDAAWLAAIIERCEACDELADRMTVVFSTLAVLRAGRWEIPAGADTQVIRDTAAVRAVREGASRPVTFSSLVSQLAAAFPDADVVRARAMVKELLGLGFLVSSLRPPMTETDSLGYLVDQLNALNVARIEPLASLVEQLTEVHCGLAAHNAAEPEDQAASRERLHLTVRELSEEGRTPLCLDLKLDVDLVVSEQVGLEMAAAADALIRLSPNPSGSPVWADYHRRFVDRFSTGTSVPLLDVIDPGIGLGYPAGYSGTVLPPPVDRSESRLEWLAALLAAGSEATLTDETIDSATGLLFDPLYIPAHIEMAARVRATSMAEVDAGRFTLHISPARAAGTLTSRFSALAAGAELEQVYRRAPAVYENAHTAQLSVPPLFVRGQNVGRTPTYLPSMISLGEHKNMGDGSIRLGELAITASMRALHVVHRESGQLIEPQVFHPLDLEKQVPPLARFLAHLPRAFVADYLVFDWGPLRSLPHLPAIRYGRSILSAEQWRLTGQTLPGMRAELSEWRQALDRWRGTTGCPRLVQLHNGDQTLRLDLAEPIHAQCLREHLNEDRPAILTEACDTRELDWIGGHAHELALPLVRSGRTAPTKLPPRLTAFTGSSHGQIPLAPASRWVSAKLFTARTYMDEVIGRHLPTLADECADAKVWFIRYRNPEETDHLRIRVSATDTATATQRAAALARWVAHLREQRLAARLSLDTYYPETGRYGSGASMDAAEAFFVADTAIAIAQLQQRPDIDQSALAAIGMFEIATAFCGGIEDAARYLAQHRPSPGPPLPRAAARTVTDSVRSLQHGERRFLPGKLAALWQARSEAAAAYRSTLPPDTDTPHMLESLMHIHHNRYLGIDRDREAICRRLARQAALTYVHTHSGQAT